MRNFSELSLRSSAFLQSTLEEIENNTLKELETSGTTIHVKNLQMINLQKTFFFIGIFSFYEALLQDRLKCKNGFEETKNILEKNDENELLENFKELQLIVNVLKHGKGRSYDQLFGKPDRKISIKIKENNKALFDEVNIDEISSLIEVDNEFIEQSIEIINEVSLKIQKYKPNIFI